jgi:peptide/nickel transport system substrate-binding protein
MMIGDIDLMRDIPIDMAENLAASPSLAATVTTPIGSSYLLIDAKGRSGRKELQDVRVRRAIMMAVNSPELTQMVVGEKQNVARPEAMCNRAQMGCDYSKPLPPFDLAGARKLLAEAGYDKGFDIEITAPSAHSGRLAEALSGRLRGIGIRAKIDTLTFAAYRDKQRLGKIELLVNGWGGGGVADVQPTLDFFFAAGPTDYFGEPKLTGLSKQISAEMDDAKRRALARQLFDTVTDIAYMAPMVPQPAYWVHSKDVAISGDVTFSAWGAYAYQIGWK